MTASSAPVHVDALDSRHAALHPLLRGLQPGATVIAAAAARGSVADRLEPGVASMLLDDPSDPTALLPAVAKALGLQVSADTIREATALAPSRSR